MSPLDPVVPGTFRETVARFGGDPGLRWLGDLPGRVADLAGRWDLTLDGPGAHGGASLVLPVRRGDEPLALKLTWMAEQLDREVAALRHWDGSGAVAVVEADPAGGASLLERLDAARPFAGVGHDEAAHILGRLIRRLAIAAADGTLRFADEMAGVRDGLAARWERHGRPFGRTVLGAAVEVAAEAAGMSTLWPMLHRDLWDDNVMWSPRRGAWLAIDPQPMAGPPEYAVGPALLRRLDRLGGVPGLERFVAGVCAAGGLDEGWARRLALVRTVDYWLWALDHGLTEDPARCDRIVAWLTARTGGVGAS